MKQLAIGACVLAMAAPAFAQGGGGPGGGRNGRGPRVEWAEDMEQALRRAGEKNACIFVYIKNSTDKDPTEFNNADVAEMSRDVVFVKLNYGRDDEWIKQWKVPVAPMILGCDKHGNDYNRANSTNIDKIRGILDAVGGLVQKYEAKLKSEYAKFLDAIRTQQNAKIGKALADLLPVLKKGFRETEDTLAKMKEIEADEVKKVVEGGRGDRDLEVEWLNEMLRDFKGTPIAAEAELRLAKIEKARDPQAAIARIKRLQKLEGVGYPSKVDSSNALWTEITSDGEAKVDEALKLDKAAAKDALRRLLRDYAGTDAAKRANEALRSVE